MLIGLTGGIGSGKSTVISFFSELGWQTLDADGICHDLYVNADSQAYIEMVDKWGRGIIAEDGAIDRKKVADIIFDNITEREWLNSVLHPRVLESALAACRPFCSNTPVIFDVPLLFEVNWEKYFTKIISVFITEETQKMRLLKRGMTVDEIKRRIAVQMPMAAKAEKADFVLVNNGSLDLLKEQCRNFEQDLNRALLKYKE